MEQMKTMGFTAASHVAIVAHKIVQIILLRRVSIKYNELLSSFYK